MPFLSFLHHPRKKKIIESGYVNGGMKYSALMASLLFIFGRATPFSAEIHPWQGLWGAAPGGRGRRGALTAGSVRYFLLSVPFASSPGGMPVQSEVNKS